MMINIRSNIYRNIRKDLRRPHPYAAERVGFVFIKYDNDRLEVTGYMSIPDEFYINDPSVGASINHHAISRAMMRAFETKESIFQIHIHEGYGIPNFSRTDINSHPDFLQSFRNANSKGIHGFILLSEDCVLTRYWLAGNASYIDTTSFSIKRDHWLQRLWRWISL
jgi:proteasome lid subunit RPN8/RPN11